VASRIEQFRLFTAHVGFVRLAIRKLDWLQPDFAIANLCFKEFDRILCDEYFMPKPEPRRLVKRIENLITECCKEAVARVFMFKQVHTLRIVLAIPPVCSHTRFLLSNRRL